MTTLLPGIETLNLVDRLIIARASPTDGKPSLKVAWLGHVNRLNCDGINHVS